VIPCDREIEALIQDGTILIDPVPDKKLWTSTAIDLTLHSVLLRWTPRPWPTGQPTHLRPMGESFNVQAMMENSTLAEKIPIDPKDGFKLEPGKFVLGFTQQKSGCRTARASPPA
jgi:deoxycytidine triphosphate deaminase